MEPTSWTVPRTNAFKWRHWNGSFVVFNPASGDTHFLNGLAGAIPKFLEAGPARIEEILNHLEEVSGQPLDKERIEQIGRLVEQFDAVRLIEPRRP